MTNKKIETNKGRTEAPMTRCKIWGKIEAHLGTGRARLAAAHCTNPFWKNIFKSLEKSTSQYFLNIPSSTGELLLYGNKCFLERGKPLDRRYYHPTEYNVEIQ